MVCHKALLIAWCALVFAAAPTLAQSPLANTSFEDGLTGWSPYTYSDPPLGQPGDVWVAQVGVGGFDVLIPNPPSAPDGDLVCGMQSWGETKNGGVCQPFAWNGGPASVTVTARAYSIYFPEWGGAPHDNGCRVRIGLVNSMTEDRAAVSTWVQFPWGNAWSSQSVVVPGPGVYTLFIESVQPDASVVMSTLWDNVTFVPWPDISVTAGPAVTIPDGGGSPDTTARIEWTTDVPSTTRVDYGSDAGYGQFSEDMTLTTSHVVHLSGLTHSSTYHYKCTSTASGYATYTSSDHTFDMPIYFREISTRLSDDGLNIVVAWKTDVPSTTQVEYGKTIDYGTLTTENTALVTEHEVTLSELDEDSRYHFRVWGRNPNDYQPACSSDGSFETLPGPSATLRNSGFEDGHGSEAHSLYPWVPYTTYVSGSGYHPIDGLVGPYPKGGPSFWPADPPSPPYPPDFQAYQGSYFLGAASHLYFKNGGVFQRVNCPPNTYVTFSTRFATYRLGGTYHDTRLRLGIDPNGGTEANSDVQWWSAFSSTNDSQWQGAGITAKSGPSGIVTVFLDVMQNPLPLQWHIVAADDASFAATPNVSIGQLKSSRGCLGAIFTDKVITHVETIDYDYKGYYLIYIQEADRSAGIAVLLDINRPELGIPEVGNKITVVGSLVVRDREAALVATDWTIDSNSYPLTAPVGVAQKSLGGVTVNQAGLFSQAGACTVGLRVRVWGRVTFSDTMGIPGMETNGYVDDGSGLYDGNSGHYRGVRVYFAPDGYRGVSVGDCVSATGVLALRRIDPDGYPGTNDEFYAFVVYTNTSDDWQTFSALP